MTDPFDLVRRFFEAINRGDIDGIEAAHHPACIVEHVFVGDPGVYEGRDRVREMWTAELQRYRGGLPGGHRLELRRVAGMQTGWGWVRADWVRAVHPIESGTARRDEGYSHFWIEDGLIRRQRSIVDLGDRVPDGARKVPEVTSARPVVGVGAVIIMDSEDVVLVRRRHEPLAGQWSLPGGGLEWGETLEAGVAREVLEETALVVDVGPVIEVFDRILMDEHEQVRYHFVLVDYLCRPRSGTLRAGSDVDAVTVADPAALGLFRMTEKTQAVIARAVQMKESRS